MTRGNQRDIDRARANNRHASDRSDKRTEGDPRKKMEDQARALQEKVAKKELLQRRQPRPAGLAEALLIVVAAV